MPWRRVRVVHIAGVLCLAGQGTLLYLAGSGSSSPRLFFSPLFLILTILQAGVLYLSLRSAGQPPFRTVSNLARNVLAGTAVLALLGVGLGFRTVRGPGDLPPAFSRSQPTRELDEVRGALAGLEPALDRLDQDLPDLPAAGVDTLGGEWEPGGNFFRDLESVPSRWEDIYPASDLFPMSAVAWMGEQRVAWTEGAEPLPFWGDPILRAADGSGRRVLVESEGRWYLREVGRLSTGIGLEFQITLDPGHVEGFRDRLRLEVLPAATVSSTVDVQGNPVVELNLGESLPGHMVRLTLTDQDWSGGSLVWRSRLLLAGLVGWAILLVLTAWAWGGPMLFLAALWVGRGLLAAAELLRWVTSAFPGQSFPADPGSMFSLVDPAYFATPFAFGWFASVADALLTSVLVAFTAWRLLQKLGVVEGANQARLPRPWPGSRWLRGPVFGLAAGLALIWLRFFAQLLAENANARLVGTGVGLSSLSFWGLQISLMLMAFGLAAVVTGLMARRTWPGRAELPSWVAGAILASGTGFLVNLTQGGLWWASGLLAALVPLILWLLAPALLARPQFLRRFAWPAILLVIVAWNYASLREIYDQAHVSWLQRRGAVITQADQEWTRILLASVLEEMVEQDGRKPSGGEPQSAVWRDEPAWALWRDSALRDLGYSCLVLLMNEEETEESLFAQGFLRTYQYEIVARSEWVGPDGQPPGNDWTMIFQTERRVYAGGEEEVVAAEVLRSGGRGWIRVELPVRSWRIATLLQELGAGSRMTGRGYRPRAEVDRPILLLRADDTGWLEAGDWGFPGPEADPIMEKLRRGDLTLAEIPLAGREWVCQWNYLPEGAARTPGEGFLLGLRRSSAREDLLDLSRLMLLDLVLLFLLFGIIQFHRWVLRDRTAANAEPWRPGFQERFLAGYLLLGLVLLIVVGTSVDKVGYDRVRGEARSRTRSGLNLAVEQLRGLLVEQARALAGSNYIEDLLVAQLGGSSPVGPIDIRQGMVFGPDGTLLLDETLSDLDDAQARQLLNAAREAPLVLVRDDGELFVGTVIPLDLEGFIPEDPSETVNAMGHSAGGTQGYFFYRQALDADLLGSLADLVDGQAMVRFDGLPVLASQPAAVFSGEAPLLAAPAAMGSLLDHPGGQGVFAAAGRPFAFSGVQPLPAFGRDVRGQLRPRLLPAALALEFPDREREYMSQRRDTILFLTGLANLILLTALLMALLMSWNIFRPLRLLLTATRSLAQGDFDAPLPDSGSDEIGRLTGAFGQMRDDLQTARDSLAAREQFLATVLDRVTVGVVVLSDAGQVTALNPAGREILAAISPEAPDTEGVAWLRESFDALAAGRERVSGELVSRDGRRTLRGAMAPLDLPDGRTDTMLVFEDITEFLDTKKMAINAELARQVAHEIKNPLTPIQLSVQLLGQAWRDKHPQLDRIVQDTVERVLDQVTLLRSIAGEFSLLGRPGELATEAMDLEALVADVVAGYGAEIDGDGTGVSMGAAAGYSVPKVRLEPGPVPAVLAHRESLQKILGNLMQNSLDAAREGHPVVIAISWLAAAHKVTLIWADNGTGLPAEVADRLFDPYFSTKSKGTGLGLAICRNLADRMGGTITLANRGDGPGAIAQLTLPRAGAAEAKERDPGIS